jgi:hypothetical protein
MQRIPNCRVYMEFLYRVSDLRLASLWHMAHLSERGALFGARLNEKGATMGQKEDLRDRRRLEALEERLRDTGTLTPGLIDEAIGVACPRVVALGAEAHAIFRRMAEAGALTDAMLRLIEIELPQWKLRRLACEDGRWRCALSEQPWLPFGFDEIMEAKHEILQLAILMALIEARRLALLRDFDRTVPQIRPAKTYTLSCDNCA